MSCTERKNSEIDDSEMFSTRQRSTHRRTRIMLFVAGILIATAMISTMVLSSTQPDIPSVTVAELQTDIGDRDLQGLLAGFSNSERFTRNDPPDLQVVRLSIDDGGTLLGTLKEQGVEGKEAHAISKTLESVFDPRKLKAGEVLTVGLYPQNGNDRRPHLQRLSLIPETDLKIVIEHRRDEQFEVVLRPIDHSNSQVTVKGTISTSLYETARNMGVPSTILLETYQLLGHAVDFQREVRPGDTFVLGYERFDDGEIGGSHPGRLSFASITLSGKSLRFLRYTTSDGYSGFFDSKGRSADSDLMKTPVDDGRLSSLFGKRNHPILGYTRMHRGLDFSAPRGAAVVAAGDGTVSKRGRNGDFGNYVRIEHSSNYATAYAHLSRYALDLKVGTRVRQGETIGYVGATGLATGPNLHYEVLRNGKATNPLSIDSPPRRILTGKEMEKFSKALSAFYEARQSADRQDTAQNQISTEDSRE